MKHLDDDVILVDEKTNVIDNKLERWQEVLDKNKLKISRDTIEILYYDHFHNFLSHY